MQLLIATALTAINLPDVAYLAERMGFHGFRQGGVNVLAFAGDGLQVFKAGLARNGRA